MALGTNDPIPNSRESVEFMAYRPRKLAGKLQEKALQGSNMRVSPQMQQTAEPQTAGHLARHRLRGRLKRALGWLTGDRRFEAEGTAELRLEKHPIPRHVDRAESELKKGYDETPLDSNNQRPSVK